MFSASFCGLPCWYNPDTGEVSGKNKLVDFLIWLIIPVCSLAFPELRIVYKHKIFFFKRPSGRFLGVCVNSNPVIECEADRPDRAIEMVQDEIDRLIG